MDPQTSDAILRGILTLAGGTAASALIAGVIELIKRLPGVGTFVDAGREYVLSLGFSAALVAYAAAATGYALNAVSGFGLFLAWYGLAKLAGSAYDEAAGLKKKLT